MAALIEVQLAATSADSGWLRSHPSLRPSTRAILLDWLRECCTGDRLSRTTYQTAVSIFDRFMSNRYNIPRNKVQLIGAGVLLIAAKLEESYRAPTIGSLLYSCDYLYTRQQLLKVESLILKVLHWRVSTPTPQVIAKLVMTRYLAAQRDPLHVAMLANNSNALQNREYRSSAFDTRLLAFAMQLCDIAMLDIEVSGGPAYLKDTSLTRSVLALHTASV